MPHRPRNGIGVTSTFGDAEQDTLVDPFGADTRLDVACVEEIEVSEDNARLEQLEIKIAEAHAKLDVLFLLVTQLFKQ